MWLKGVLILGSVQVQRYNMAPQEHSYRQVPAEPRHTYYQTPFQAAGAGYEAAALGEDSDNQPIMSNLVRRSKSVTDAYLTNELQPSDRRRSFFSRRKSKLTTEQPDLSVPTPGRSFSSLLPSQALATDSDNKPATGTGKGSKLKVEADADSSKSKSSRWWSWGSGSKALKPDGKAPLPADGRGTAIKEAGSSSRPSSLELAGQPDVDNIAASSGQLAHTSPLVQSGCMSMFMTAPAQTEKPVSQVQWAGRHSCCPVHISICRLVTLVATLQYLHTRTLQYPSLARSSLCCNSAANTGCKCHLCPTTGLYAFSLALCAVQTQISATAETTML